MACMHCCHVQVQLSRYTQEEYDSQVKAGSGDWSKAETDYLFDLCERFDLRFIVIADRYEVCCSANIKVLPQCPCSMYAA